MRRLPAALLLFGLLAVPTVTVFGGQAHAATPSEQSKQPNLQEEAQKALRSVRAQTKLPLEYAPELPKLEKDQQKKPDVSVSSDLQGVSKILFWCALGVILMLLVLTLRKSLWSQSRSTEFAAEKDREEKTDATATAVRMERARFAADELAGMGRFSEAMHVLLLQCLNEMRLRLDISFAVSLTSREILRKLTLPEQQKTLFASIIERVEISYFGTHEPEKAEYESCRADYERLTGILRGGAMS